MSWLNVLTLAATFRISYLLRVALGEAGCGHTQCLEANAESAGD